MVTRRITSRNSNLISTISPSAILERALIIISTSRALAVVVLIELTDGRLYDNVLLGVNDDGWLSVIAGKSSTTVMCVAAAELNVLLITCDFGNEVGHRHFNIKFYGVGERVKLDIPMILLVRVEIRYT